MLYDHQRIWFVDGADFNDECCDRVSRAERNRKASGVFNMLHQLGSVFGIAVLAIVFAANGDYTSAQLFTNGFAPAILASGFLSLAGLLMGMALPARKRKLAANKEEEAHEREHCLIASPTGDL